MLAAAGGVVVPAASPFQVHIVKYGMMRISETMLKAMCNTVESELNSVAKTSKKASVQKGFKINLVLPATSGVYSASKPTEFIVYLVDNARPDVALKLAKRHLSIQDEKRMLAEIAAKVKAEGGANISVGGKSVSVVGVQQYAGMDRGPMSEKERAERAVKAGNKLAELVLHELGHAMEAVHGDGLMKPVLVHGLDDPALHFSATSRREILRSLEKRVKTK